MSAGHQEGCKDHAGPRWSALPAATVFMLVSNLARPPSRDAREAGLHPVPLRWRTGDPEAPAHVLCYEQIGVELCALYAVMGAGEVPNGGCIYWCGPFLNMFAILFLLDFQRVYLQRGGPVPSDPVDAGRPVAMDEAAAEMVAYGLYTASPAVSFTDTREFRPGPGKRVPGAGVLAAHLRGLGCKEQWAPKQRSRPVHGLLPRALLSLWAAALSNT